MWVLLDHALDSGAQALELRLLRELRQLHLGEAYLLQHLLRLQAPVLEKNVQTCFPGPPLRRVRTQTEKVANQIKGEGICMSKIKPPKMGICLSST